MKVGLFFGSFNPIHVGHLIIANTVRGLTGLHQVWFVVSPQNPFKPAHTLLPDIDRLRMVELAVEDNYDLRACNIEFSMPKPSFTVDTLAYLSERHPEHQFYLIMGADNLAHFHKWKNYRQILEQAGVYTYPRPGVAQVPEALRDHAGIVPVEAPLLDISATFIRNCIRQDVSIKYLVPDAVEAYILGKKFYL